MIMLNPLSMGFGGRTSQFGAQGFGLKVNETNHGRRSSQMVDSTLTQTVIEDHNYRIGVLPLDDHMMDGLRSNNSAANSYKSQDDYLGRSGNNSMDEIDMRKVMDGQESQDSERKKSNRKDGDDNS